MINDGALHWRRPVAAAPWKADRACQGMPTALFFPEDGVKATAASAKAVCRTCPVREECLDFALDNHEDFGIWGGTTEKERRRIRRERLARRRGAA